MDTKSYRKGFNQIDDEQGLPPNVKVLIGLLIFIGQQRCLQVQTHTETIYTCIYNLNYRHVLFSNNFIAVLLQYHVSNHDRFKLGIFLMINCNDLSSLLMALSNRSYCVEDKLVEAFAYEVDQYRTVGLLNTHFDLRAILSATSV